MAEHRSSYMDAEGRAGREIRGKRPIGSHVSVNFGDVFSGTDWREGVVVKHGRDASGIYTRVRVDGKLVDFHPAGVWPGGLCDCGHPIGAHEDGDCPACSCARPEVRP